ncbi:MAG TPA: GNAT family N-acetyltransferase [Rhodobacteraceae bacterium]|jgi:predicted N-acyltransferase|nr:GNAT family N-acetyltransferase [Paracoccaceae bacterium]
MPDQIEITILNQISDIAADEWNACAGPTSGRAIDPFTTHRFLLALENSGSVGAGTGWHPRHIAAYQNDRLIGVAPTYAKTHSQGEYVFDHSWADAYMRAGGQYYPKLQITVPFTPVTGRRLLTRTGYETIGQTALLQGAVQLAADHGLSSMHITFCTESEAIAGKAMGLMHRIGQQFHWVNDGYKTFDDFLSSLSSRKRKNIRRERRQAQGFGGTIHTFTGDEITPEHMEAFWGFYQDTSARKWGTPYLSREFFNIAHENLRADIFLVMAKRGETWVAGALNFIGAETLFGRYWGCIEDHPALHFEICYYRAIDFAIQQALTKIEAGAQGEHKLSRGYLPAITHSLHWIADDGFREAVAQFLQHERQAVDHDIEIMTSYGPFKRGL